MSGTTRLMANLYQAVAASQTAQALGSTGGAINDVFEGVLIVPASTSPGAVSITDGSNTAVTIFAGGSSSVSSLVSFFVPLAGIRSVSGGWKITTGANVSVLAIGLFS